MSTNYTKYWFELNIFLLILTSTRPIQMKKSAVSYFPDKSGFTSLRLETFFTQKRILQFSSLWLLHFTIAESHLIKFALTLDRSLICYKSKTFSTGIQIVSLNTQSVFNLLSTYLIQLSRFSSHNQHSFS